LNSRVSARVPARKYDSVQQDWRAILPSASNALFCDHTTRLENAYLMLSISLDEAIALRKGGDSAKSIVGLGVLEELCSRFALHINAVLHAMAQYARHFGIIPNSAQLDLANFHSSRSQRAVRHSNLVSHILLSERSQFLNKLNTLEDIVDELGDEFIEKTRRLATGVPFKTSELWDYLELNHFDLNTCLRETDVLLKSFLCVLPEDQLGRFDFTICGLARARRPRASVTQSDLIRARRTATVAGE